MPCPMSLYTTDLLGSPGKVSRQAERKALRAASSIGNSCPGRMRISSISSPERCVSVSNVRIVSISSSKRSSRKGACDPIGKTSTIPPRTQNSPLFEQKPRPQNKRGGRKPLRSGCSRRENHVAVGFAFGALFPRLGVDDKFPKRLKPFAYQVLVRTHRVVGKRLPVGEHGDSQRRIKPGEFVGKLNHVARVGADDDRKARALRTISAAESPRLMPASAVRSVFCAGAGKRKPSGKTCGNLGSGMLQE